MLSTAVAKLSPIASNTLSKFRFLTYRGSFPVEYINWGSDKNGDASKDGGGNLEFVLVFDIAVHCVSRINKSAKSNMLSKMLKGPNLLGVE